MSNLYRWATSSSESAPTAADAAEAATPSEDAETGNRRSERLASTKGNVSNLQLPSRSRYPSPQLRARDLSSSRSPRSPSARQEDAFSFNSIMDADAIRALVQETARASIDASTSAVTSMLPGAVRTAVRDQVRDVSSLTRKPELPAFDKANIEIWIRRVENAFIRAGIDVIKDRFAFLESKIGVDTDPKVTEYLFIPDPDETTWASFTSHLRKRYGRTRRQQVQSLITGTEFDGLQPSAVVALMKEKAGKVTVDDIIKEHVYRRLPVELQRQLAQEHETMTATELSELADNFYDKDGRPIHAATSSTSVNAIGGGDSNAFNPNASSRSTASSNSSSTSNAFTAAFNADDNDINSVRQRQQQKQRYNNNNNKNNNNNNNNARSNNTGNRSNNNNDRYPAKSPQIGANGLCHFHEKFGNDAFKCLTGCKRWSAHQALKGQASRQ